VRASERHRILRNGGENTWRQAAKAAETSMAWQCRAGPGSRKASPVRPSR
jgi:hypothetical protein